MMQLFLSWSGGLSRDVAGVLHKWIPSVLQSVEPFLSADDIDKGDRWSDQIASKLQESGFGIIILTSENLLAPWILFEAGALSRMVGQTNVAPLLINVQVTQVRPPLTQFQATKFEKVDIFKLLKSINKNCSMSVREEILERTFEALWPQLKDDIEKELTKYVSSGIPKSKPIDINSLNTSVGDLIELVQGLRDEVRRGANRSVMPAVARDMRKVHDILEQNKDEVGDIIMMSEDSSIVLKLSFAITNYLERNSGLLRRPLKRVSDAIESESNSTNIPK